MKNTVKNTFYATTWLVLLSISKVNAVINFEWTTVNENLKWNNNSLDIVLQNWLGYLTGLLYFVAIVMMVWGGFNIITAWGEEEKAKKWKTILMQAAAWLIVVFLANSLISWIINLLFASAG